MTKLKTKLTLAEFLALPEEDLNYEFVNGEAIPKMSPKFFHSSLTGSLYIRLLQGIQNQGRVGIEWSVKLTRKEKDWMPVPDLLYVSYSRLPADWMENEACPVPPELAIEIISPDQTFGDLSEKAIDYLNAGVSRVWVVDPKSKSITIFYPDAAPQTKKGDALLTDSLLEGLQLTPKQLFEQAGIP